MFCKYDQNQKKNATPFSVYVFLKGKEKEAAHVETHFYTYSIP